MASGVNIYDPNPLRPMDSRYAGQFETSADLPDGYPDDSVAIVLNSGDPQVWKVASDVWSLLGSLVGGEVTPGPATELDANGTTLTVDAIADGEYLRRVGTTVVSGTPSASTATAINDGTTTLDLSTIADGEVLFRLGTSVLGIEPYGLFPKVFSYVGATLSTAALAYGGNGHRYFFQNACAVTLTDVGADYDGATMFLMNQSADTITLTTSGVTMTPGSVSLVGAGSWAICSWSDGDSTWSVLTNSTTSTLTTLTSDVDGAGYDISDFNVEGVRDKPYDLSTDSLGMNSAGTVTLRDDINLVYHSNVTSALTIKFPTVTAGEAPYGTFSFGLGSGGSITLDTTPEYQWEKVNVSDSNPTLPTTAGSYGHIYYRYDPVSSKYLASLTRTGDPAASGSGINIEAFNISSLSSGNRDTHNYTHTYVSTTQDGTVYLIAGFATDAVSSVEITPPAGFTAILAPTGSDIDSARQWWGYYKPTQGDLDGGTEAIQFGMTNEMGQIMTLEVSGVDETSPIHTSGGDYSSAGRTAVGPVTLSVSTTGVLLVSCMSGNDSLTTGTVTPTNTSGWTEQVNYQNAGYMPPILVHTKADAGIASHDTPTYTSPNAVEKMICAFALLPA